MPKSELDPPQPWQWLGQFEPWSSSKTPRQMWQTNPKSFGTSALNPPFNWAHVLPLESGLRIGRIAIPKWCTCIHRLSFTWLPEDQQRFEIYRYIAIITTTIITSSITVITIMHSSLTRTHSASSWIPAASVMWPGPTVPEATQGTKWD